MHPELQWIKDHGIRRGDIVVDCGANHGFSSILFARWTGPAGTVHAIEPSPHNVEILRENLRLNDAENVTLHAVAAGAHNGRATVTDHPNASVTHEPSAKVISVEMRRLDDEINDSTVDFIKIDVEGFELEVLRGAAMLLSHRPRLALELHICMYEDAASMLDQIFTLLRPYSYTMAVQTKVDGPIEPLNSAFHSLELLGRCEIVHLFCK